MKKVILVCVLWMLSVNVSAEDACVVHVEKDFNIKGKIEEGGCVAGDILLLFNEAKSRKWQSLLPIRAASVVVCDMNKPITDSQDQGLQYVMCTFTGEYRKLKMDKKFTKGWLWF